MDYSSKTYQGLLRLRNYGFDPIGIIDVGAHDGFWSISARRIFPNAHILMLDALSEKEEQLRQVSLQIGNSESKIALLGSVPCIEKDFFFVNANGISTGSSLFKENTSYSVETRKLSVYTLDEIAGSAAHYDFIKLDTQGAEIHILDGAPFISSCAEVMLLEVATLPYNDGAPLIHEVVDYMNKIDFVLFDVLDELRLPSGCLFQMDILFVKKNSKLLPKPPY